MSNSINDDSHVLPVVEPGLDSQTDSDLEEENRAPVGPPCRHLRSKGMYVFNDVPAGEDGEDDDGTTIYWCARTATGFGPDDEMARAHDCRNLSRTCYEPI